MTLKVQLTRAASNFGLLVVVLAALSPYNPASALTGDQSANSLPEFLDFVEQVRNGETGVLRGVYVPGVLALPVAQQPEDDPNYVSSRNGEATQFSTASQYGNIGLLAHNTLSGRSFSRLAVGQEVLLIYGDGKIEAFVIREILRFQALQPWSAWSEFRDLNGDEILSVQEMFMRVYSGARHLTFQTCIAASGNLSWGRLFVIATPSP